MKMRPKLLLLAGGAALALGACATVGLRHHGVTFHDAFIEIHPGTNIKAVEQKQLDKILSQYDKSLYKIIKRTANGKVTTQGRLKDVLIEESLLEEVRNAGNVSFSALQIGTQAHPDHTEHPSHTAHPEHNDHPSFLPTPDHPSVIGYKICVELVNRVTPVLKKYSGD
jgi:hypothetical protein